MKSVFQAFTIAWVLVLSACGSSGESEVSNTPAAQVDVPINPLPASERN
jgi:predicted small lipoprotein YifL